jgi:hypothetical protein
MVDEFAVSFSASFPVHDRGSDGETMAGWQRGMIVRGTHGPERQLV